MRVTLLLLCVTIAYCQKNATDTTRKKTATNDVVVSIVKISRDSPRPLVAYNQGSLTPPFPAIAKIRSKTKPTSSDQIITDVGSEAISGLNEDLHKLVNTLEHAKGSKGAFYRKATRTGSTYSTNPFQVEYTGEPYLSGYRGIPEGQETSSGGPNYMGALTKSNKAGKHTFGSYGSIDSEKAQMWQSRSMGSNVAGYDRSGWNLLLYNLIVHMPAMRITMADIQFLLPYTSVQNQLTVPDQIRTVPVTKKVPTTVTVLAIGTAAVTIQTTAVK
ncbi:hypothetical protein V3C99_000971 [Haemonchus contortus]|uniref:Transferrin binding protein B n=1 Tax=Haemonchus contortus TaxID=6289 RepID=A0A7I4YCW0_HAECO|nr:C. briggsae CBR-PQN-29 protein [Haemonchus contortus]